MSTEQWAKSKEQKVVNKENFQRSQLMPNNCQFPLSRSVEISKRGLILDAFLIESCLVELVCGSFGFELYGIGNEFLFFCFCMFFFSVYCPPLPPSLPTMTLLQMFMLMWPAFSFGNRIESSINPDRQADGGGLKSRVCCETKGKWTAKIMLKVSFPSRSKRWYFELSFKRGIFNIQIWCKLVCWEVEFVLHAIKLWSMVLLLFSLVLC